MPDPTVESASHAAVKRLDDLTSRRISASVRITSLGALAARLLSNAVFEGRATRVSLVINLDEWRIECEDNGVGFSGAALEALSDADQIESLKGLTQHEQERLLLLRRGTLCSAAALGALQIWTRTAASSRGLELRAKQDAQILHPPSDATDDVDGPLHSQSSGLTDRAAGVREGFSTKVVVRDLFHCLPVRREVATSHGPDVLDLLSQ